MKPSRTVTVNGGDTPFDAYGPFVSWNRCKWYLVHAIAYCNRGSEFLVVDLHEGQGHVWLRGDEPQVHYAFASAVIGLLGEPESDGAMNFARGLVEYHGSVEKAAMAYEDLIKSSKQTADPERIRRRLRVGKALSDLAESQKAEAK